MTIQLVRPAFARSIVALVAGTIPLTAGAQPVSESARGLKSEGVAFRASLLGTVGPIAVGLALAAPGPTNDAAIPSILFITGGVALGPSLGHFYAGRPGRATATAVLRTGVMAASLIIAFSACPLEGCTDEEEATAAISTVTGAAVAAGLAIYDIVTAKASVRRHNQRISLIPWVPPRGRGVGVIASLRL